MLCTVFLRLFTKTQSGLTHCCQSLTWSRRSWRRWRSRCRWHWWWGRNCSQRPHGTGWQDRSAYTTWTDTKGVLIGSCSSVVRYSNLLGLSVYLRMNVFGFNCYINKLPSKSCLCEERHQGLGAMKSARGVSLPFMCTPHQTLMHE